MKKIFALLVGVLLVSTMNVSAQKKGDLAVGGGVYFGSLLPTAAIGATVHYNIIDEVRIAGNIDYFIKNKGAQTLDFTFDGHYLFPLSDKIVLYPIVGVGISALLTDGGNRVPFVANVGGGFQYNVSSRLRLTFEIKGRLGNGVCQAVIGPSLIYAF